MLQDVPKAQAARSCHWPDGQQEDSCSPALTIPEGPAYRKQPTVPQGQDGQYPMHEGQRRPHYGYSRIAHIAQLLRPTLPAAKAAAFDGADGLRMTYAVVHQAS